ncbi:MAG: alpha/beta hydrolase, partial [Planctomycetota bacterium]
MGRTTRTVAATLTVLLLASPRTPAAAEPQPDALRVYKKTGDKPLRLHLFFPPTHEATDARPAIVFFFGGGWTGGGPTQFYHQAERLASRGMVAACAEYRTAKSHGTDPRACVRDGKSA